MEEDLSTFNISYKSCFSSRLFIGAERKVAKLPELLSLSYKEQDKVADGAEVETTNGANLTPRTTLAWLQEYQGQGGFPPKVS